MKIRFLGGASEVGRLGMLLHHGSRTMLFDYGFLPHDPPAYPMEAPPVDAVLLSHAHLDHSGMIPWLTRRYDVPVLATPPTLDVADLLHLDSIKVAEAEGFAPPYVRADVEAARRRYEVAEFGETVETGNVEVTLHRAGHIPGATMFEVNDHETLLFTGDVHTLTTDLVRGAEPVACDTLVIESTYAGRRHPDRLATQHAFLRKVEEVVNRGGLALVPSFAVGRTQEVLLTLARARHEVWLNGMGRTVNSIYMGNPRYVRSGKRLRQAVNRARIIRSMRGDAAALRGEVIVTTSGMLDGGPVLKYLDAIREDPKSAVLLTGYQVEGTNGRRLLEEGRVDLNGVLVPVRCELQSYDFSAHADHDQLLAFIEGCDPKRVVLMHGDRRERLAESLTGRDVLLPMEGKTYEV
jgi:putative mRNA 3-end processing factor